MTKKIFQSILLVAGAVLLASLLIIMGFLYSYFGGVEENQLRDELSLASVAVESSGTDYLSQLTAERYRRGYRPDDSIYRFYAREMGVVITSQRCAVRYECVKGSEAVRLAVPDPMPVLRFARISMAFGHLPVEYRIYRLDAENSQICFALP